MNITNPDHPFVETKNSCSDDSQSTTTESYDPAIIQSILDNPGSIDDTVTIKTQELIQDTINTGTFIQRTKAELEELFYGFNEIIVRPREQPWYERLAFWKDVQDEVEIKHPGLYDRISSTLSSMQQGLLHVKQQLHANGRTVRNMITYAIGLEEDAQIAQSQLRQTALYAQHLVERKKSICAYIQTDEFSSQLEPEKRTAILLAEDRADEELDLLRTAANTLEFKSQLYKQNADATKKMARVMRFRFSRFYEVIAQAVNQVNQLQLAAQSGSFLQLDTDVQELVDNMQEAHQILEEHGSFMYGLQSHLSHLSEDALSIPQQTLPSTTQRQLDAVIGEHNTHYDWIQKVLNS